MITPRQQVFAIAASLLLLLVIVELVRRRQLREEYAWIWLLMGVAIVLPTVFYPALAWFSQLIGAVVVTTTLFILALLFVILICLQYAVRVSRLTTQLKNLAQEIALLQATLAATGAAAGRETPPDAASPSQ